MTARTIRVNATGSPRMCYARPKAISMSAMRSESCSMPIDSRIVESRKLAQAKPFAPEWSGVPNALDLRYTATAIQVNDSTRRTFLTKLTDEGTSDYAEIGLGTGKDWLNSRLFIWAIVFSDEKHRVLRIRRSVRSREERFVGWGNVRRLIRTRPS